MPAYAPAPSIPEPGVGGVRGIFGQLEVIRAETQDWLRSVDALVALSSMSDVAARTSEIARVFQQEKPVIEDNLSHLGDLVQALEQRIKDDPTVAVQMGDELTGVANGLKRAGFLWTSVVTDDPKGDALLLRLKPIDSELQDVIWRCGFVTIPDRINAHLRSLRIGQGLDFKANFEDELRRESDRKKLLGYLFSHPGAITGVVDVGKGKIFKASSLAMRRVMSVLLVIAFVAIDFLAVWVVARWVPSLEVPGATGSAERWSVLWKILAAILAGSIVHIAVSAIKQSRDRSGDQAFLAIDDMFLWIHVREVQLSLSVLSYVIGVLGTILVLKKTDVVTAFFVGYSFDSFIDIFLERFENTATAQMTTLAPAGGAPA